MKRTERIQDRGANPLTSTIGTLLARKQIKASDGLPMVTEFIDSR